MSNFEIECKTCGKPSEAVPNPYYGQRFSAPQMIATCPDGHTQGYSPRQPEDGRLTQGW